MWVVAVDEMQERPEEPPLRAKVASVPEMEQRKEKKSQKTLWQMEGVEQVVFRHNNLCVCVSSAAMVKNWKLNCAQSRWVHYFDASVGVGSACQHAWSSGKWEFGQNKDLS